ncbi:hypothetical protein [uncultured Roseobacter sp.]|uniref:hypothetical protein n=1 Tax=uncultured Roseobacter sp. TaxID=114847 RepID=UPI002627AA9E|nr:hypothetical protein [uncultured Roseobacter sp.]
MTDNTKIMTLALMLVGGGPSSTAGVITVMTVIVLAFATLNVFRRQERLNVFGTVWGWRS